METRWIPLEPERISPKELLEFRNRVLEIDDIPTEIEITALQNQLNECHKDGTLYNLIAINNNKVIAWVNGKFAPSRNVNTVRVIFFDFAELSQLRVKHLLNELKESMPNPEYRMEIYGMGPGREKDIELIKSSGFHKTFDISHYRLIISNKHDMGNEISLTYKHKIDNEIAYGLFEKAFRTTWERDSLSKAEFLMAIDSYDTRLSFTAYLNDEVAGMVIVKLGVDSNEVYLQIIAVTDDMRGMRVGDSMMSYLMVRIRERDIKSVTLCTYSDNQAMKNLMKRWGFEEELTETVLFSNE